MSRPVDYICIYRTELLHYDISGINHLYSGIVTLCVRVLCLSDWIINHIIAVPAVDTCNPMLFQVCYQRTSIVPFLNSTGLKLDHLMNGAAI